MSQPKDKRDFGEEIDKARKRSVFASSSLFIHPSASFEPWYRLRPFRISLPGASRIVSDLNCYQLYSRSLCHMGTFRGKSAGKAGLGVTSVEMAPAWKNNPKP